MALHLVTGYKGEAHITAEDVGAFNAGIFGKGEYVMNTGNCFAIEKIDFNNFKILDGDAMIQGRHITLKAGTYEEVTINNGNIGESRIDLVVMRYTKDEQTGVENVSFAVVQGEPVTSGTPVEPEVVTGDLLSGNCLKHEVPLYKISIVDNSASTPVKLFKTMTGYSNLIVASKYRGDLNESQFIDLGFTPDAVYVARSDGSTTRTDWTGGYGTYIFGGLALKGSDCRFWNDKVGDKPIVTIVEGGFKVFYYQERIDGTSSNSAETYIRANDNAEYFYIAFNLSGGVM